MLIILSPAKTLDFDTPSPVVKATQPLMLKSAAELVDIMKAKSPDEISQLMGISEKLALLNADRFSSWSTPFNKSNAKQAVMAFKGDVYTGLEAYSFNQDDADYAQAHLRILSGLYGILRPLDLIQAYRLEMGTRLVNNKGENLYQYWGDSLAKALNKQLRAIGSSELVNLASNEYFSAVDQSALKASLITPVFKDKKNGKYKIVSFYAKKARGMMAAYATKRRLTQAKQLKKFTGGGYRYSTEESSKNQWVFLRDTPEDK